MLLKYRIAAGLAGAAVVIAIALALQSYTGGRAPPLAGTMRNFTPTKTLAPAPAFAFRDRAGSTLGLADFRGRVVLVNFWATWCAPCVREMPTLASLHAKLAGEGLTLIALSEDRKGWQVIDPFLANTGLVRLPVYLDVDGEAIRVLRVFGLPTTVLFDREGRELGRLAGVAEWDSDETVALMRYYLRN